MVWVPILTVATCSSHHWSGRSLKGRRRKTNEVLLQKPHGRYVFVLCLRNTYRILFILIFPIKEVLGLKIMSWAWARAMQMVGNA